MRGALQQYQDTGILHGVAVGGQPVLRDRDGGALADMARGPEIRLVGGGEHDEDSRRHALEQHMAGQRITVGAAGAIAGAALPVRPEVAVGIKLAEPDQAAGHGLGLDRRHGRFRAGGREVGRSLLRLLRLGGGGFRLLLQHPLEPALLAGGFPMRTGLRRGGTGIAHALHPRRIQAGKVGIFHRHLLAHHLLLDAASPGCRPLLRRVGAFLPQPLLRARRVERQVRLEHQPSPGFGMVAETGHMALHDAAVPDAASLHQRPLHIDGQVAQVQRTRRNGRTNKNKCHESERKGEAEASCALAPADGPSGALNPSDHFSP